MLWFFALTEDSTAFRQYAEMLMVAVHTARKFTSLVPYFIYDGSDNDFTVWLRKHDVRIIRHRSLFRDALAELGRKKGNPHFEAALSGAFSRVEVPEIVASLDGAERVLYTDCDVIFVAEVVPELEANPCQYFAVAPEGVADDYVNMNTGVMLMNTKRLRESLPEFREYIARNHREEVCKRLSFISSISPYSSHGFEAKRNDENEGDRPERKNRKQKSVLGCVEGRGVKPGEQCSAQEDRARQEQDRASNATVLLHTLLGKKQTDEG